MVWAIRYHGARSESGLYLTKDHRYGDRETKTDVLTFESHADALAKVDELTRLFGMHMWSYHAVQVDAVDTERELLRSTGNFADVAGYRRPSEIVDCATKECDDARRRIVDLEERLLQAQKGSRAAIDALDAERQDHRATHARLHAIESALRPTTEICRRARTNLDAVRNRPANCHMEPVDVGRVYFAEDAATRLVCDAVLELFPEKKEPTT